MPDPITKDSLNPEKRQQLDSNIKMMLERGASQQDVMTYAADFKSKFSVKKKEETQSTSPSTELASDPVQEVGSSVGIRYDNPVVEFIKNPPVTVSNPESEAGKEYLAIKQEYENRPPMQVNHDDLLTRISKLQPKLRAKKSALELQAQDVNKVRKDIESAEAKANALSKVTGKDAIDILKGNENYKQLKLKETRIKGNDFITTFGSNLFNGSAGISGTPSAIVESLGRLMVGSEDYEKIPESDRENFFSELLSNIPINNLNALGKVSLSGNKRQKELITNSEQLREVATKYDSAITEDIGNMDLAQAGKRIAVEGVGSIPSLIQAVTPYVGIASIVTGSAANKLEENKDSKGIGKDDVVDAWINGASEGLLEVISKGLATKMFKSFGPMAKEEAKTLSKSLVDNLIYSPLKEGGSEAATEIVNKLSDAFVLGNEQDIQENVYQILDSFAIGGFVGGSMGSVTAIGENMKLHKKAIDGDVDSQMKIEQISLLETNIEASKKSIENVNNDENLSEGEKNKLVTELEDAINKNTSSIEEILGVESKKDIIDAKTEENASKTEESTVEESAPKSEAATKENEVNTPQTENTSNSRELETNEAVSKENTSIDGDTTVRDNTNIQKTEGADVQTTVKSDPVKSENTIKRVNPKGVKGEFDVEIDEKGSVKSIKTKDGREVPKIIMRKLKNNKKNKKLYPKLEKPGRNPNYSRIEAEAIGAKTDNEIREQETKVVNEAVASFEPSNEYEAALHYMANGGKVKLSDAKSQGQGAKGGKWAAGFNQEENLPSIERASEIISESLGLENIDQQVVRDELESIIRENGSIDEVRKKLMELRNEKESEAKEQELYAYKNSLTEKELANFESIIAEDDYLSELSYEDKVSYYEEQFESKIPKNDGEREGENPSVQERTGEKKVESKSTEEGSVNDEVQAQGITGKSGNNRDSALSEGGAVKKKNVFHEKFKRFWNKSFRTNAGAPKEIAGLIRSLGREVSAITSALEHEVGVLNKIASSAKKKSKKDFKKNLKSINDYISGDTKADVSFFNAEQINDLDALRSRIDSLSDVLISKLRDKIAVQEAKLENHKEGSLGYSSISESIDRINSLAETIEGNKGKYLYRSYDAFNNSEYLDNLTSKNANSEGKKRIKNAVDFIVEESEGKLTEKEARKQVFEYLDNLKNKGDFTTQATAGRADAPFLKKRKDIPEPIRELLGESKDPIANYVNTVFKISNFVASIEYQDSLSKELLDSGLGTYEAQEGYTKLTSDSEGWQGLHGIYVPTELFNAIEDLQPLKSVENDIYRSLIAFAALTKIGKTVMSPTTTFRNFYSGVFLGINAGFLSGSNPKLAAKAFSLAWGTKKSKTQLKAESYKLHQLGVLGDGAVSQEIMETMNDFSNEVERMISKNVVKKGVDSLKKVYALGDDFYKVIGFYTYKNRYMKSGLTEAQAEAKAAERLTDTFPTYSMLPKNIQELRRAPFVGTFVSFPYEVLRTTKNTFSYIKEDIEAGRNKMALQQVAGLFVANATLGAIGLITRNMIGFDDDDDDTLRNMLPEWQKNSKLIYTGKDEYGQPTFMDGTALFPAEVYLKPLRSLLEDRKGRNFEDKLKEGTDEFFTPYIGLDISYKTVNELISNKDVYGKKIYDAENLGGAIFTNPDKVAQHYLKNAGPGVYSNITEFMRANEIQPDFFGDKFTSYGREYNNKDALMGLLGFRFSTINYSSGMSSMGFELKEKYNDVRSKISGKIKSTKELNREQISKLIEEYREVNEDVSEKMLSAIKGSRKLGLKDSDIEKALSQSGFSNSDIDDLIYGFTPPLKEISKTTERNQVDKLELNYKDVEKGNQIIDNYYKNVDLFNEMIKDVPYTKEKTNPD